MTHEQQLYAKAARYWEEALKLLGTNATAEDYSYAAAANYNAAYYLDDSSENRSHKQQLFAKAARYLEEALKLLGTNATAQDYSYAEAANYNAAYYLDDSSENRSHKQQLFAKAAEYREEVLKRPGEPNTLAENYFDAADTNGSVI